MCELMPIRPQTLCSPSPFIIAMSIVERSTSFAQTVCKNVMLNQLVFMKGRAPFCVVFVNILICLLNPYVVRTFHDSPSICKLLEFAIYNAAAKFRFGISGLQGLCPNATLLLALFFYSKNTSVTLRNLLLYHF